MPHPTVNSAAVPKWIVYTGSIAILLHLFAVVTQVLAAPSGAWPTNEGSTMATPPQFAYRLSSLLTPSYLSAIKMTHNYHFPSNRPGLPGVWFEVHLKDGVGDVVETLTFPQKDSGFSVSQRQAKLARNLADDQPVQPPAGEVIPAPSQQARTVKILEFAENNTLKIVTKPEHLIPRDRPVFSPSDWSLLLARSYSRYLCRIHGAASAELIRHTREPYTPAVLFMDRSAFSNVDELVTIFGDFPR